MFILRMSSLIISLMFCLTSSWIAIAESSSFVHEGSIGKRVAPEIEQPEDEFATIPLEEWIGEKFIFLPQSEGTKKLGFGYQKFKLPYDEYVGRIATVVRVEQKSEYLATVHFQMDDNGSFVKGQSFEGVIHDIGPLADIQKARDKWLNETLWLNSTKLTSYNVKTDSFDSIENMRFTPVVVRNVVAGWYDHCPVRFIVESPDGNQGFYDVNLSGTNVSKRRGDNLWYRFDSKFFEVDPKTLYDFSERAWEAIAERQVFIGMTAEQAKLSWGEPQKINRTTARGKRIEQWVYSSNNYLYIENGKVSGIQN